MPVGWRGPPPQTLAPAAAPLPRRCSRTARPRHPRTGGLEGGRRADAAGATLHAGAARVGDNVGVDCQNVGDCCAGSGERGWIQRVGWAAPGQCGPRGLGPAGPTGRLWRMASAAPPAQRAGKKGHRASAQLLRQCAIALLDFEELADSLQLAGEEGKGEGGARQGSL